MEMKDLIIGFLAGTACLIAAPNEWRALFLMLVVALIIILLQR